MTSIITTIQPKILPVIHGHTPRSQVQKLANAFLTARNTDLQTPPRDHLLRTKTVMQRFQHMQPEQRQHFLNTLNKVASGDPAPAKPRRQLQETTHDPLKKMTPSPNRANPSTIPGTVPPPPPMPQAESNIPQSPRLWGKVIGVNPLEILAERDSRRVMSKPHMPTGMNDLMQELTAQLKKRNNMSA
ncbi:MAG: hypothetical protein ACRC2U_01115 [Aeromonas sp.]